MIARLLDRTLLAPRYTGALIGNGLIAVAALSIWAVLVDPDPAAFRLTALAVALPAVLLGAAVDAFVRPLSRLARLLTRGSQ